MYIPNKHIADTRSLLFPFLVTKLFFFFVFLCCPRNALTLDLKLKDEANLRSRQYLLLL